MFLHKKQVRPVFEAVLKDFPWLWSVIHGDWSRKDFNVHRILQLDDIEGRVSFNELVPTTIVAYFETGGVPHVGVITPERLVELTSWNPPAGEFDRGGIRIANILRETFAVANNIVIDLKAVAVTTPNFCIIWVLAPNS